MTSALESYEEEINCIAGVTVNVTGVAGNAYWTVTRRSDSIHTEMGHLL